MADTRPKPNKRPPGTAPDKAAPRQTVVRPARPEPEAVVSLIAEAERIMGVKPILGRTSRLLPGY